MNAVFHNCKHAELTKINTAKVDERSACSSALIFDTPWTTLIAGMQRLPRVVSAIVEGAHCNLLISVQNWMGRFAALAPDPLPERLMRWLAQQVCRLPDGRPGTVRHDRA